MGKTVFFSWQSDTPRKDNQNFIEKCIRRSIKDLKDSMPLSIYINLDRATDGIPGSPDIKESILRKIDHSAVFICDITFINHGCSDKQTPNPNVLFELGYALHILGSERVICFFNSEFGNLTNLPFDIRNLRIVSYLIKNENRKSEEKRISKIISATLTLLHAKGFLFNPLNDYQKKKIDRCILDIAKTLCNLVYGSVSMSEGLARVSSFMNLEPDILNNTMMEAEFLGCFFFNVYTTQKEDLIEILEVMLASSYFPREWSVFIISLLEWIDRKTRLTIPNYEPFPVVKTDTKPNGNYGLASAYKMNSDNPKNSYLLLEKLNEDESIVINSLILRGAPHKESWLAMFTLNKNVPEILISLVTDFIKLCDNWLELTDGEFILDPEYYTIFPNNMKKLPLIHEM